jgi:succinoglycan biosynthesis protein ExoM
MQSSPASLEPVDVSVCVCTYRRAHVVETIRSVLAQAIAPRALEVVVVDDDPELSARAAVEAVAALSPIPVRYVACAAGNVADARNACLDAAGGDWIAFIDDDEIAGSDWLAALIDAQARYSADVVKGFVRAVYPAGTPQWVRDADPFTRDYGPTGTAPVLLATGNVLFRRALIHDNGLRFDPEFGRTGGEDTDFFRRVRRVTDRIVATREAVVQEIVPPERLSLSYLSDRARRMGQVEAHKARRGISETSLAGNIVRATACVALLWPYRLLRPFGARPAYKTFAKFWYSLGVLEGAALARRSEMT